MRAPVLAKELRYVRVSGFVEEFERRAGRRDRLTLRVISLGKLAPDGWPYRVRVTTFAQDFVPRTGQAVTLRATLRPPPEPVPPGAFDFGRQA
jgi:competence protein ComEC